MSDRYAPVGDFIRSTITSQTSNEPAQPWKKDALCNGQPGDLWFADPGESWKVQEAKAICRMCPAETACLQYALNNGEKWGIWGGLTAAERTRVIKPNPTTPTKPTAIYCGYCGQKFEASRSNIKYCPDHRTSTHRDALKRRRAA